MIFIIFFIVSGLVIVLFLAIKNFEKKSKKKFFILHAISKRDIYIRKYYHRIIHFYSSGKEKVSFSFKRQIPMHSKNSFNKIVSFLKEQKERHVNNIRDSKLLKRPDGISEFFKNMSEIEKGNGEMNDVYEDSSQEDKKEVK